MAGIFDSLKNLITPELISEAANFLGEDESNVTKAATSLIPSLLGALLAKGDSPKVESALTSAGKDSSNILGSISNIFSGNITDKDHSVGSQFLNSILGDKLNGLSSIISSVSGISPQSTNKFISMVAPIVSAFLGNKLTSGGLNLSGLLSMLSKEKGSFLDFIPSGLGSLLGVSSLANLGNSISSGVSSGVQNTKHVVEEASNSNMSWLKWLLGLLFVGLALFFLLKACHKNKVTEAISSTTVTTVDNVKDAANNIADKINDTIKRISTELSLPNGLKITAFKGGIEDQIINFLNSDEYKNATPEILKDKWFDFDNIEFKHGSATELTETSTVQLKNIVSILDYFKDAKVKIGGYTDKTGTPEANMKLSQERANTIKSILEKGGIDAKRINAEGYGDKFAKYDASAPDSDRAHDRRIALRFEK